MAISRRSEGTAMGARLGAAMAAITVVGLMAGQTTAAIDAGTETVTASTPEVGMAHWGFDLVALIAAILLMALRTGGFAHAGDQLSRIDAVEALPIRCVARRRLLLAQDLVADAAVVAAWRVCMACQASSLTTLNS